MPNPALNVCVADMHVNSKYGLSLPQVELDNGGYYRASESQREVYRAWNAFWAIIERKKVETEATVYVEVVGDAPDKNKHDKFDRITDNESIIIDHTVELLLPASRVADHLFIVRGTEAHVGGHGFLEECIAHELGAEKNTLTNQWSWWWLPLLTQSVDWDIAHHGDTFARRPWTLDSAAERQSAILRDQYCERGERPPRMAVRAHQHTFTYSNGRLSPWTFFLPPFCLANAFAHRLGAGAHIEPVGGVWWLCRDGKVTQWDKERWRPRRTPQWKET